jgi:hypothetical protein
VEEPPSRVDETSEEPSEVRHVAKASLPSLVPMTAPGVVGNPRLAPPVR